MKVILILALLVAPCSFANAATIELPNPTARQVVNVQCGTPNQIPMAAGFSQPGDYAVAVVVGYDSCSLGGRAHLMRRYYRCAVVQWDLTGYMVDVRQFDANPDHSCTVPADTLYPAPQGYSISIHLNDQGSLHAFLETP